ncbi:hypothetical protein OF117_19630 [Geodermatophilus sp. YIM 151500]|uniref:hypothetical protein n=1 Tax=Geodermatophilus sp. YIM 151500 TaxID=2984531 RepID=UPI0021E3FE34|nr:hypothetical protein [Geodermatophilus sp. YIM 151500]MCV2491560.1 hypothetical protein [Geodermatophilus sp. YIM 151500]
MTTPSPPGRALPEVLLRVAAVLRLPVDRDAVPVDPAPVPPGWERQDFDADRDRDLDPLEWLGFRPAPRLDRPRLSWSRPARWPAGEPAEAPGEPADPPAGERPGGPAVPG